MGPVSLFPMLIIFARSTSAFALTCLVVNFGGNLNPVDALRVVLRLETEALRLGFLVLDLQRHLCLVVGAGAHVTQILGATALGLQQLYFFLGLTCFFLAFGILL